MTDNGNYFNISVVNEHFNQSLLRDDMDIDLKFYLLSYNELNKFFELIGTVFGFVSSDLKEKIQTLEMLLENDPVNFQTIKQMINYEKENNLLKKKKYVSGSRTLLRLHRGLNFIRMFLKKLTEISETDGTGYICREAYDETLVKHHSYLIATTAKMAMYTMPNKQQLFEKVCGNDEDFLKQSLINLPGALEIMNLVWDITDKVYTENDLHSLP